MNKEVKDDFKASVFWFCVFVLMLICSIITGIDGIFCFIGMFSLIAGIICLVGGIVNSVKNKVENTNTYINIKEKQKQKEVETQKRQDMLNEVQKRLERLTKLADVFTKGSELYNMSMNLLKQNYRHAISLRSRQMRMKAYKELQDSLIFAETSFEALIVSAREARNEAIFIKNIVEDEKLPIPIDKLNLDNLIQSLDNVLSFRIEDDEEYMDIKCFCEEKLHSDIN